MKTDLTTPAKRAKLAPRKSPYSVRLADHTALLLAVGATKSRWKARTPLGGDKVLADASKLPADADANGETILSFEQARAAVLALAAQQAADAAKSPAELAAEAEAQKADTMTVLDAWTAYENWCEASGKTDGALRVIRSYGRVIRADLGNVAIGAPLHVWQGWANALVRAPSDGDRGRSAVGANKIIGSLKAALAKTGVDGPWQKLKKHKEAQKGADDAKVLSAAEAGALVSAAHDLDPAFGDFCEALWLTGARPNELRLCDVSDVRTNADTGAVYLLIRHGKNAAKTGDRRVILSPAGQTFFVNLATGRPGSDPLLLDPSGHHWGEYGHKYLLPKSVAAAGLNEAVTLYSFRHSFITAAIYRRVPLTSLARSCGTSLAMIEKTYAHTLADLEAAAWADLDGALKVTPLRVVS